MKSIILVLSPLLLLAASILGLYLTNNPKDKFEAPQSKYPFKLPPLPYPYGYVDEWVGIETMRAHHDSHHQTYVNKLNEACAESKYLQGKTLTQLVTHPMTSEIAAIQKHGGGHYYHSLFWWILTAAQVDARPSAGKLGQAINDKWGSFEAFQRDFEVAAKGVFGSGWAILANCKGEGLKILARPNQDIPECPFILGLDVWEHAYYLDYKWKRAGYISKFWAMIDWATVERFYEEYASRGLYVPF